MKRIPWNTALKVVLLESEYIAGSSAKLGDRRGHDLIGLLDLSARRKRAEHLGRGVRLDQYCLTVGARQMVRLAWMDRRLAKP